MKAKSSYTTYEFSTDDLQELVATNLGVPREFVTVTFTTSNFSSGMMDRDDYRTSGVLAVVDNKALAEHREHVHDFYSQDDRPVPGTGRFGG